jgi:hypothetical protein
MPRQQSIVLIRESDAFPADLKYSWIPTAITHDLKLAPDQTLGTESDSNKNPDDIHQVQVYHLYDGALEAVKDGESFQFPSGPPYVSPISYAVVELSQQRKIATFTAHFADGASFSEFRPLKPSRPDGR